MKKTLIAILVAGLMAPALSFAEKGDFVIRTRATYVAPDDRSKLDTTTTLFPGDKLSVDSNVIPEIDFSYYITKNIATELILAVGSRHDVNVTGPDAQKLGSVNLLPPTLTVQWHFNPDQTFDPYAGAGLSYVRAMDNNLTSTKTTLSGVTAGSGIHIDRNMWGPAIQAGIDVNLQDKWLVNFDVKKIWFNTDVFANPSTKIDSLDIDPWVVSFGVGKKF